MNRVRALSCASFVIAGVWPSPVKAQTVPLDLPRAPVDDTLSVIGDASARLLSLGVVRQELAVRTLRVRLQDPQRKNPPVSAGRLFDSITPSALQCPMPVARLAPEAVSVMRVAAIETTNAAAGVVLSGCINPLDRRP